MDIDALIVYQSDFSKIRLGRPNDGGYVICDLPPSSSIYYDLLISGGVDVDISFEENFMNMYDVECIAFDGTVKKFPESSKRIQFINKNLNDREDSINEKIDTHLDGYQNVFLKMDIEGFEYKIFESLSSEQMNKIKQMVVEFHSHLDIQMHSGYYNSETHNVDRSIFFETLKKISLTHTLVHIHGNNGCEVADLENVKFPQVFEATYIRNDLVKTKRRNLEKFPSILDQPNSKERPDIVLEGHPYTS